MTETQEQGRDWDFIRTQQASSVKLRVLKSIEYDKDYEEMELEETTSSAIPFVKG